MENEEATAAGGWILAAGAAAWMSRRSHRSKQVPNTHGKGAWRTYEYDSNWRLIRSYPSEKPNMD
jgi:hypothetical protein